MISIRFDKVDLNPDGSIEIRYTGGQSGSGNGIKWPSREMLKLDVDMLLSQELEVVKLFVAWWAARNSALTNKALVENKTMIVDMSSPNAIKVQ